MRRAEPVRVAVTRPLAEAEGTARRLVEAGHAPLVAPVLAVFATGETPPDGTFDGILATSAHAAAGLAALKPRLGDRLVFAVGERTRAAAEVSGYRAIAAEGTGRDLARLVLATLAPGAALLHVAGRDRKPEPGQSLLAAGFRLETWTSYGVDAVPHLPRPFAAALRDGELDAALHYSRRSAEIACRLAAEAGLAAAFASLLHAALSADVAAALAEFGCPRIAVADSPDETALLRCLGGATASPPPRPGC